MLDTLSGPAVRLRRYDTDQRSESARATEGNTSADGSDTSDTRGVASAPERADAARNREIILAAAADLFDRAGAEAVSMQDIAEAAGVGKGTVFRRFGDRTTLIEAVLYPRSTALRRHIEQSPPPLGAGRRSGRDA